MKNSKTYDVMVIGGGINGVGIAADAAGRGLSVLLCEQGDIAGATSSASSKLIHGGLRYLEYGDFSLVKSALQERSLLLNCAPHLIKPVRFVVPINKSVRPFWLIKLGLFLYDFLSPKSTLKRSKVIHLKPSIHNPLKGSFSRGFIYSDCFVDDARLVISNAQQARHFGATILTRMRCIHAKRTPDFWQISLQDTITHQIQGVYAKSLINASGPWIENVINQLQLPSKHHIRLVKGSHIIVPKLYEGEEAYVLQHHDNRIVFVIPYLKDYALIGTTDLPYEGSLEQVHIDPFEKEYLCNVVSEYFDQPLKPHQILNTWSGVRPLIDDNTTTLAAINRGYKLELQVDANNFLPLINIFGGKLTTYRLVAEKVLDLLLPFFAHCGKAWTAKQPLPGGDFPEKNFAFFLEQLIQDFKWVPSALLLRYAQSYGTLTYTLLENTKNIADLGQDFGHCLYEKEVDYLICNEWARSAEDILRRRTKLIYVFSLQETENLNRYIHTKLANH